MDKQLGKCPVSKVELHVHLDGAVRPSTVFDVAKKRQMTLDAKNAEELAKQIQIDLGGGISLTNFLSKFNIFMPIIAGDAETVKRIAYEWCEDSAKQGIIYSEVRYCPHLFANTVTDPEFCTPGDLAPDQVVELVCQGLEQGSNDFNIKVRSILCCMHHRPEWSGEILDLCVKYKDRGVVAIDLAGDEQPAEVRPAHKLHLQAFKDAERLGVNRTVHAGEQGSKHNIIEALEKMHAERIGHGYKAEDDPGLVKRLVQDQIHVEMCPISSYITGSVKLLPQFTDHPLPKFVRDGIHYSISTDDPILTGTGLCGDYMFAIEKLGLSWSDIYRANLNAAEAAFLPDDEKKELVNRLKEEYGSD